MKKILINSLIISSLFLASCGGNSNNQATWSVGWSTSFDKNYKVKMYSCTKQDLKWGCSEIDKDHIGIFKATANLCELVNIQDKDEVKLENITTENSNPKLISFKVDPQTKIVKLIVANKTIKNWEETNPKNIDVLFDLTYYSVDNKDLENEVINSRKEKLKQELENVLNKWDTVSLRYIWTIDYGTYPEHKNAVLKETDSFKLKWSYSKVETKYYSLTLRCKAFKRTKSLKIYTHIENKKKEDFVNTKEEIPTFTNKDNLISAVFNKIDEKYNSWKYSYGTYFLETLSNYEDFLNRKDWTKNDVNIIISDFKFQLHPIMKKRKNIPENVNFWFPPEKLSLWKKWTIYYNFYTKTIPTYFEDRCSHHEKLELVGLETDDIEIKKIMKDYYKNYLFKKCDVEFK